ncbi:hypothetical protein [Algimonas arctica]|nr:hypothetical protein [Algimonas arctica]
MTRIFFFITLVWAALTQSALAQGVAAQSDNFSLISDAPVDAADILSDLETFQRAVIEDLGLTQTVVTEPLRLNIIDDPKTFAAITPGGVTAAIYLQSAAGHDIIVGHRTEPGHLLSNALDPNGLRLVLRHEVVHHILETRYARKLPVWLGEGLAEYYATYARGADGRATFGRALPEQDPLTDNQTWLPMRTVIENMAKYPDFRFASSGPPSRAQRIYYGQSWALAHFVMDQPEGLARVHRFVDGWAPNIDSEDSFEQAFGLRYDPLETRVREDIIREGGGVRLGPLASAAAPASAIITTTPSPQALIANRLRLVLTHGPDTDLTYEQMIALRARLTAPVETNALDLARALRAWRVTDWDGSDAAIDRILARTPDHARALKIRAKTAYGRVSERQSEQSLWDAAEAAAIQGLAARPDDAELHLFRVAVSLPVTQNISPGAQISLDWLQARNTHLRLPHAAMMMIPALIYENRFEHADRVLDSAARWKETAGDKWVIERLRGNVAAERAERE